MRVIGFLPPFALAAGVAVVALNWNLVAGAYTGVDRPIPDIQLSGIDLAVEPTPIGPSPYGVTTAPDTRNVPVELAFADDVRGAGPDPVITGGSAALAGIVTLPSGPAPGATVRLERHTVDGMASIEVPTGPDGRWSVPNLVGGRYRVRAWLTGSATMTGSDVFFLGADQALQLDLALDPVDPTPELRFARKGDVYLGGTGTVAATVTVRTVDDDGLLVVSGLAGAIVTLTPSGAATLAVPTVTADGDGVARFELACHQLGPSGGTIAHQNQTITVDLPGCIPVPPPATVAPDPATTLTSSSPSSAPVSGAKPVTTTTRATTRSSGTTRG